jgi:hypothetical protein
MQRVLEELKKLKEQPEPVKTAAASPKKAWWQIGQ